MKKILVIGSTVVDVIITVDHLPRTTEDVHVITQETALGGCAYNVSDTIRHFGTPYTLFSPIGTGIYGDYIRSEFAKRGLSSPLPTPNKDNGCCYCFVEESGERTFISNHGAEYLIYDEWLREVDVTELSHVYVCGLEVEETTGPDVVKFMERASAAGVTIWFAPGPRLERLPDELVERIFALSPIIHLNADEVCLFTGEATVEAAAAALYSKTGNTVIVTDGENGAYHYDGVALVYAEPFPAKQVVDTIGAGDSHIGACIACCAMGKSMHEAICIANRVASAVVSVKGGCLSGDEFDALQLC